MLINFENITARRTGRLVFPKTNFAIPPATCIGIAGKNGSGKTTFLSIIAGKLPIIEGKVLKDENQLISSLCHLVEFNMFKLLPIFIEHYYQQRYHAYGPEAFPKVWDFLINKRNIFIETPLKDEAFEEQVNDWLIFFGIESLKNVSVIQLSNGEQKRLMLIKALLCNPKVLLLDEPYVGLDKNGVDILNNMLMRLLTIGKSIVMVSAEMNFPEFCTIRYQVSECEIRLLKDKDLTGIKKISLPIPNPVANPQELIYFDHIRIQSNGRSLLDDIDWKVYESECWWIHGENGSGKSTLLSLIFADHPQAYAQKINVFGIPRYGGNSIWEIKQQIGFISPEFQLQFEHRCSCQQIIGSGIQENKPLERTLTKEVWQEAYNLLEQLEIAYLADKYFNEISTGEQRMVLLLRAFIKNPKVLILDEPFQGIDHQTQNNMLTYIAHYISANPKTAILFTTHQYESIPNFITHQLKLSFGRLIEKKVYQSENE